MIRRDSAVDTRRDMIYSFMDLGSLDVKCIRETYLDNTNTLSGSQSLSPTSDTQLSPEINAFWSPTPLFSSTPIPNVANSSTALPHPRPQPQSYGYFIGENKVLGENTSLHTINTTKLQQRQQNCNVYDESRNQQNSTYRVAGDAFAQKQQKDEISKSLKTFAMLAAYEYGNDIIKHIHEDSSVDDIMEDFYCNGYITDDTNLYRDGVASLLRHQYFPNYDNPSNNGIPNNLNSNLINYGTNNACSVNRVLNNYNAAATLNPHHFNTNLWMMQMTSPAPFCSIGVTSLGAHQRETNAASIAATAAAAVNLDYNSQNIKKPSKRYGNIKFDKSAIKHCVFCENNNEPEVLVKSHAVRDSLGRVLCPKLRTYVCPICKDSGDNAHTVKYCPQKPIITMEDAVKAESLRLSKNSYYKQGMKV